MANPADNTVSGLLNILPQANSTVYITDGQGLYEEFRIQNHYEKDRKTYQMGISSPAGFQGQSVAFVQLAAPTLLWICNWTLGRVGALVVAPDPSPSVSDWVLLDDWWDADQIEVAGADGQALYYRLSGTFVYGHPNPAPNTNANIVFPLTPWINPSLVTVDIRSVTNDSLTKGLSDIQGGIVKPTQTPLGNITVGGGAGGATGQGILLGNITIR